jgi:hypothetical protein
VTVSGALRARTSGTYRCGVNGATTTRTRIESDSLFACLRVNTMVRRRESVLNGPLQWIKAPAIVKWEFPLNFWRKQNFLPFDSYLADVRSTAQGWDGDTACWALHKWMTLLEGWVNSSFNLFHGRTIQTIIHYASYLCRRETLCPPWSTAALP